MQITALSKRLLPPPGAVPSICLPHVSVCIVLILTYVLVLYIVVHVLILVCCQFDCALTNVVFSEESPCPRGFAKTIL